MSDFNDYQRKTGDTAIYPKGQAVEYLTLGLVSEAGEVAGKVKKVIRDNAGKFTPEDMLEIQAELGDILWYLARMADLIGFDLSEVADNNLEKLRSRSARGVLIGSGDKR